MRVISAGDIDDRLGPEGELASLRTEYPSLDAYLNRALAVNHDYNIPYGAGISEDGQTVYIDSRLDTMVNGVDCAQALATHETTEWALREFCGIGLDYAADPRGHRLANRAEYEKVNELLGNPGSGDYEANWEAYDDALDPQIRRIEHAEIGIAPADLALYPYEGTAILERLREAMS